MQANVGDIVKNNKQQLEMQILEIIDSQRIKIKFLKSGYETIVYKHNFYAGRVRDKFSGMNKDYRYGYIGNGNYKDENGNKSKSYSYWAHMIRRSCDLNFKSDSRNLAYADVSVCDEWLNFENFDKWFNENYYECPFGGFMCLDKDILVKHNKVYSPETCCFVPNNINVLFLKQKYHKDKGIPFGSKLGKNADGSIKYIVRTTEYRKEKNIGTYKTKEEAFFAYKQEKERYIKEVAELYKPYIPKNVYDAMMKYEVEEND